MSTDEDVDHPTPTVTSVPGRVVAVAATKGGVGRTTVAANLAAALHAAGQRVCLVDLDLEFGDVALSLGLTPVRTLLDAVEAAIPDDIEDPLELLKTEFRPGFDCVLAPIDPSAAKTLPVGLVADLLPALAETYDFVLVDTSAHQSPHVEAACKAADRVLLIANPDVLNAKALHLQVDLLNVSGARADRDLVINRAPVNQAVSPGVAWADLSDSIGLPVALLLTHSVDVPRALLKGVPLVLEDPAHQFSAQFRTLAESWIAPPEDSGTAEGRKKKRRGLRKGKKS
jgi:pilus assembly protein CpaE